MRGIDKILKTNAIIKSLSDSESDKVAAPKLESTSINFRKRGVASTIMDTESDPCFAKPLPIQENLAKFLIDSALVNTADVLA